MTKIPKWAYVAIGVLVLLLLYLSFSTPVKVQLTQVPYSQLKTYVSQGLVDAVELRGNLLTAQLSKPLAATLGEREVDRVETRVPVTGDPDLFALFESQDVVVTTLPETEASPSRLLYALLPWVVLFGVYFWFWNRMQRNITGRFGGREPSDFLAGSARKEQKSERVITFADVAGQENAKREVAELVDFLRTPETYTRLGVEPPRGVLMMGPPGTGKTLLARALAGEAGVPFFHTSASEFIEMYVGVGASRVRKMFDEAKARAPAIIFIDELDAVGRVRGAGLGGGNDEREQTLNQILSELDGFAGHEAVIVLAATNRPDVLDPALLRPGRFDRHVTLELPDRAARKDILKVHTRKVPLEPGVDLDAVAQGTPGFSGADLKNLVNESAMATVRRKADKVSMADFDTMRDRVMMGAVRSMAIHPVEHHRLAVHEAGHTAAAHYLPLSDPLYKVTIIPRGRSLGSTHMLPEEERHTLPEDYLKDRLAVTLAGRAAEKLFIGDVSSGADDDIQRASQLARAMVSRWGMDKNIGPVDLRQSEEHPFLGREIAQPRRFSETTAHEVDEAVSSLLRQAESRAAEVLTAHREKLEVLIARLEENETLARDEIDSCLGPTPTAGKAAQ